MLSPRIVHRVISVSAVIALAAPAAAAQDFEGVVTMHTSGGSRNADVQYMVRNGAVRIDGSGPGGGGAVIMDPQKKTTTLLLPQMKMYSESAWDPSKEMSKAADHDVQIDKTGKMETVAGYSCEHWIVTDKTEGKDNATDVCVTKQLGGFAPMRMGQGGPHPAWMDQVKDIFPLKVTKVGDTQSEMVVTKVEKKSLDPQLFQVPSDYTKMDMSKMVQERMSQQKSKP